MRQEDCHDADACRHDVLEAVAIYDLLFAEAFDLEHERVVLSHFIRKLVSHKICAVPEVGYDDGTDRKDEMCDAIGENSQSAARRSSHTNGVGPTLWQYAKTHSKYEYQEQCNEKFRYAVGRHTYPANYSIYRFTLSAHTEYCQQKSEDEYQGE